MMGSLGHSKGFGQLLRVRVRGILAWFVRRSYYLMQMPGWSRRLRIMIDWTFALLFTPDVVKLDLASEDVLFLRDAAAGAAAEKGPGSTAGPATPPANVSPQQPGAPSLAQEKR
jgi:NADH dehydrogenase